MSLLSKGRLSVLVGLLVLAGACSSQPTTPEPASAVGSGIGEPQSAAPTLATASVTAKSETAPSASPTETAGMAPQEVVSQMPQVPIGYSVGERVPDFQLTLVDGSTFSAQDLISEGRPVFLFFTASW